MQRVLRKIFGIHPGEGLTALRFLKLSVVWGFASSCFETLADGLFLEKVGTSYLPYVYMIGSISLIIISALIIHQLRIRSPYQVLSTVLKIAFALCLSVIFLLPFQPPDFFWIILKISARIFFCVYLASAWTFVDQYHDLQEAKRVYSLYSAAYFLGIVVSGLLINLFLSEIGHRWFYLIILGAISLGLYFSKQITQNTTAVHDDTIEGIFSGDRHGMRSLIHKIFTSPYTISLLLLSLIQQIALITTEFNYLETFEKAFESGSIQKRFTANNVSEFLGSLRAWISLANIIVGGFLYRPLVKKIGIGNVILLTPFFFFFVYSIWIFQDNPWIAILGLVAVDGMVFTVEDNSFNLLTKAVPSKIKSKVRIINDSFFEPIGMLISSVLFFLFASHQCKTLGFTFSIGLIIISFILRKLYPGALFSNLKENMIQFHKKAREWFMSFSKKEQKEAIEDILEGLESEDLAVSNLAKEFLERIDMEESELPEDLFFRNYSLSKIVHASSRFNPKEKRMAEKLIVKKGHAGIPILIKSLKSTQIHMSGRILSSKVLARISPDHLTTAFEEILKQEKKRAYFYFYHASTLSKRYPDLDLSHLEDAFFTSLRSIIDFIVHLLSATGKIEDADLLAQSLQSKNEKVHSSAVETLENGSDKKTFRWLLPLIEEIPDHEKKKAWEENLPKKDQMNLEELIEFLSDSPFLYERIIVNQMREDAIPQFN